MLIWISMLFACTNSGLGQTGTGDTASDVLACPWVGEWQLTDMRCGGSFDYQGWFETYPDAKMVIEAGEGSACNVEFTWTGPKCAEVESWELEPQFPEESTVQWDGSTQWVNSGVTECSPPSCTFDTTAVNVADSPCAEGDRESPTVVVVDVDISVDDQLTISGLLGEDERGTCGLDPTSIWVKQ